MKKLALTLAVVSALGLSGCDDETITDLQEEVKNEDQVVLPSTRVVYDPANGILPLPNDLLFSGTTDGTLNPPVADPTDYSDPVVAVSALDGWSTFTPFVLDFDFPDSTGLDATSAASPGAIRIFEALMGGDAGCESVPRGAACQVVGELTFGVDFVTSEKNGSLAVVPLKPMKAKTTYLLALTNQLSDTNGNPVKPSESYALVKQDLATKPLDTEDRRMLQGLVNSFEAVLSSGGVDAESIIYSTPITTQSVSDTLAVAKQLLVANPMMIPSVGVADTTLSSADALIGAGVLDPTDPADAPLIGLYSAANLYMGSVTLPYYSAMPTAENPAAPLDGFWTAACDSGAILAAIGATNPELIPAEPQSENDGFCMNFGLRDLGFDTERNLTKFNPIPKVTSYNELEVQMTVPDVVVANVVRAQLGLAGEIAEPEAGWPVVILQHGITGNKEQMIALTGLLAVNGIASVAIDHPLHASRAFGPINAEGNPFVYTNIGNILNARDNKRQSIADMLGLRVALNFTQGANIDGTKVHFLGHSLGAITGVGFVGLANATLGDPMADAMFKVSTNTLAMGGGAYGHMLNSPAFEPNAKANLAYAGSEDFQMYADARGAAEGRSNTDADWGVYLGTLWYDFYDMLTPEQALEVDAFFDTYMFAAQTGLDSMDPVNYAAAVTASGVPTYMIEVVGNGVDNLPDVVVPNTLPTTPLGGTEGLAMALGVSGISETTMDTEMGVSGIVRFLSGHHGSILTPEQIPGVSNELSGRATQEMQTQAVSFMATMGTVLPVTDSEVVAQ